MHGKLAAADALWHKHCWSCNCCRAWRVCNQAWAPDVLFCPLCPTLFVQSKHQAFYICLGPKSPRLSWSLVSKTTEPIKYSISPAAFCFNFFPVAYSMPPSGTSNHLQKAQSTSSALQVGLRLPAEDPECSNRPQWLHHRDHLPGRKPDPGLRLLGPPRGHHLLPTLLPD